MDDVDGVPMLLVTFSYVSRLLVGLLSAELEAIRRSSEVYNREHDVTGLLLFDGEYFAQIIEGPHRGLGEVRRRIMRDPRHELVQVGPQVAVAGRQFADWSLRVLNTRPLPATEAIAFKSGDGSGLRVHPELLDFFQGAAKRSRDMPASTDP